MFSDRLKTLLAYRRQVEDAAVQALSQATAARVRAEGEEAKLAAALATARAVLSANRGKVPEGTEPALHAADRQRFAARLASQTQACAQRLAEHRQAVLEPALRAEEEARGRHLGARQEREAIEKHRDDSRADAAKLAQRQQEAEQDDRRNPRDK